MSDYVIREGLKHGAGRYWGVKPSGVYGWTVRGNAEAFPRADAYGLVRDLEVDEGMGECRPVKRTVRRG